MKIGYCLSCNPPQVLAAGTTIESLKGHKLKSGAIHFDPKKVKTIEVESKPMKLGEKPQAYLDRLAVELKDRLK